MKEDLKPLVSKEVTDIKGVGAIVAKDAIGGEPAKLLDTRMFCSDTLVARLLTLRCT